jgi:hypothetical protein
MKGTGMSHTTDPTSSPTVGQRPTPSRVRLVRATVAFLMIIGIVPVVTVTAPTPAQAAACIDRVVNRYPGWVGIGNLRLGRVGVNVKACTTTRPTQWSFAISDVVTNGTAENFGLTLRASRGDVQHGRKTAYVRITTSFRECVDLPGIDPICRTTGVMRFQVWVNAYGSEPVLSVRNFSSDLPLAYTIYRTP